MHLLFACSVYDLISLSKMHLLSYCTIASARFHHYLFYIHNQKTFNPRSVATILNFDQTHCHKWALLLQERHSKLVVAQKSIQNQNFEAALKLFNEIFTGFYAGKNVDPGMAGSLLYHMAMVTKMESETRVLLNELNVACPDVSDRLNMFYSAFVADAKELTQSLGAFTVDAQQTVNQPYLTSTQKISLFTQLTLENKKVKALLKAKNPQASNAFEKLFQTWANQIIQMRLIQEYETMKGLLVLSELANTLGLPAVEVAMERVQDKFGQETVDIALDVTLKVGLRREKLQSVMLSDHYIKMVMDAAKLDGQMVFLNCPIHGSHKYAQQKYGVNPDVSTLFCRHFCFAHAKAMLNTVLLFPFTLWHPKIMAKDGNCEFYLKLAHSPTADPNERFVPLIMSWNVTRECNMKCGHCYINATDKKLQNELTTNEAKKLIDQIAEVSHPLLVLSGGEPLLRKDIYELIRYGTSKGLKMGLGSNGSLIDDAVADKLKEAGINTVSISLDSNVPEQHDEFRGVPGSWQKAVNAITALRKRGVLMQVNTTVTQQNYNQIDDIMSLVENLGVENFHLFFLVPTGRGTKIADISPEKYEEMIKVTFAKTAKHKLNVKPSCAPQFMRIAKGMGLDMRQWIRGCIAGMYYIRIYPNGDVTPCPYLPVKLGNIKEKSFKEIWFSSDMLKALRDPMCLKGKCGACEFKDVCGGCRARAYGLSSDFIDYCGDLHEPAELKGDYLAEDPWCVYQPGSFKKP
jgi:AdoMet-dependent heme synthase